MVPLGGTIVGPQHLGRLLDRLWKPIPQNLEHTTFFARPGVREHSRETVDGLDVQPQTVVEPIGLPGGCGRTVQTLRDTRVIGGPVEDVEVIILNHTIPHVTDDEFEVILNSRVHKDGRDGVVKRRSRVDRDGVRRRRVRHHGRDELRLGRVEGLVLDDTIPSSRTLPVPQRDLQLDDRISQTHRISRAETPPFMEGRKRVRVFLC